MSTGPDVCPVQKTALLLSDTWTILIMRDLMQQPRRFCELERSLKGISTRTLTNKLKKLAEQDLVKKNAEYYEATPKGKGLRTVDRAMRAYGTQYL